MPFNQRFPKTTADNRVDKIERILPTKDKYQYADNKNERLSKYQKDGKSDILEYKKDMVLYGSDEKTTKQQSKKQFKQEKAIVEAVSEYEEEGSESGETEEMDVALAEQEERETTEEQQERELMQNISADSKAKVAIKRIDEVLSNENVNLPKDEADNLSKYLLQFKTQVKDPKVKSELETTIFKLDAYVMGLEDPSSSSLSEQSIVSEEANERLKKSLEKEIRQEDLEVEKRLEKKKEQLRAETERMKSAEKAIRESKQMTSAQKEKQIKDIEAKEKGFKTTKRSYKAKMKDFIESTKAYKKIENRNEEFVALKAMAEEVKDMENTLKFMEQHHKDYYKTNRFAQEWLIQKGINLADAKRKVEEGIKKHEDLQRVAERAKSEGLKPGQTEFMKELEEDAGKVEVRREGERSGNISAREKSREKLLEKKRRERADVKKSSVTPEKTTQNKQPKKKGKKKK